MSEDSVAALCRTAGSTHSATLPTFPLHLFKITEVLNHITVIMLIVTGLVAGGEVRGRVVSHPASRKDRVPYIHVKSTPVPVPGQLDEAVITPGGAPAVLNQDVLRGVGYCSHCVVGTCSFGTVSVDAG